MTCFMRLGARPARSAAQRDTCVSGKRCNAAGRVPRRTEGREKFVTGGVAIRLWYTYHGANRSCPVANFSPVKQVNINDPWYYLSTGHLRNTGFRRAMRQAGMIPDPDLIVLAENYREEPGRRACAELLSRSAKFTALIAANDLLALGCLDAFAEAGINCPNDVSVSGFNDMPFLSRLNPPLTTVRISHYHMGTRAAETILGLAKESGLPVQRLLVEPQLVIRDSTAPPH